MNWFKYLLLHDLKAPKWKWTSIVGLHKQSQYLKSYTSASFFVFNRVNEITQQLYSILLHIFDKRGGFVMQMDCGNTDKKPIGRLKKVRIRKCVHRIPFTKAECSCFFRTFHLYKKQSRNLYKTKKNLKCCRKNKKSSVQRNKLKHCTTKIPLKWIITWM